MLFQQQPALTLITLKDWKEKPMSRPDESLDIEIAYLKQRMGFQTYTTPRFEDTTPQKALSQAQSLLARIEKLQEEIRKLTDIADGNIQLSEELVAKKVSKVQDLPEERRHYWKKRIYWPTQSQIQQ